MKKTIIACAVVGGLVGVGIVGWGVSQGWFSSAPPTTDMPTDDPAVPEALPELVEWIDTRIASGDRKQEAAGYAELADPETFPRLLVAIEDEKTPVPLRKRALLLVARRQGGTEIVPALAQKHAGDPKSPLRAQAVVVLAGLRDLEKRDTGGYITVTLATAAKDPDERLRLSATHGLVRLKSKAAVQALVERLADESPTVRKAAAKRLKKLAGEDLGYRYSLNPKDLAEAVHRWRAWAAKYEPKP